MPSSRTHNSHPTWRGQAVGESRSRAAGAKRAGGLTAERAPIEDVLSALLDDDPQRALAAVEAAGGPSAFDDDAAFVASVYAQRELDLSLDDARALAKLIAADVEATRVAPEGGGRDLLARLAQALGLATRARTRREPVHLATSDAPRWRDPRDRHAVAPTRSVRQDGASVADLAGGDLLRSVAPAASRRSHVGTSLVDGFGPDRAARAARANHAPAVRGILRDAHASEGWLPRVDRLAVLIAPAAMPGVYALQRRALPGPSTSKMPSPHAVRRALGSGRPLPDAVKRRLADRTGFELAVAGVDLERVRIHDGAEADGLCRALACEAFALGTHIAFRAGAFRPEADDGLHLLVHELTHIAQQARGEVGPGIDPAASLEREAEAMADRLLAWHSPTDAASGESASTPIESALPDVATSTPGDVHAEPEHALQRCGPKAMAAARAAPRGDDAVEDKAEGEREADGDGKREGEAEDVPRAPPETPSSIAPSRDEDDPRWPEGDPQRAAFEPLREVPRREPKAGKKAIDLRLAGRVIRVEVPEAQAQGKVEVVFDENPSPFAALTLERAELELDADLRVLRGELRAAVSIEPYLRASVTLEVFDDGRIGAEIRGLQADLGEGLRAHLDLSVGPEGVWGAGTVSAESLRLSDEIAVSAGVLHVRIETNGSVSAHGIVTAEVAGLGSIELEACFLDGQWGGHVKTLEAAAKEAKSAARAKSTALRDLRLEALATRVDDALEQPPDDDQEDQDRDDEQETEEDLELAEEIFDDLDHADDRDWEHGWL